jgi:hypothetical protein
MSRKGEQMKKPEPVKGNTEGKDDGFPDIDSCLMIFGGLMAYKSRQRQKLTCQEVYAVDPATPSFLKWSESAITFNQSDHPSSLPQQGRCPLVVDPIVGMKRLTKVLMDGGSSLNIMGIDRSRIRPSGAPFHVIVLGKQAITLRQIDLPITFGYPTNYRTETHTFEVVGFHGSYHAILGRPWYVKFMAVPNYTYLKLKMLGSHGVITIVSSFQRAYQCEVESCELASTVIASEELTVILEETAKEVPDSNRNSRSFEPAEGIK